MPPFNPKFLGSSALEFGNLREVFLEGRGRSGNELASAAPPPVMLWPLPQLFFTFLKGILVF